MSDKKTIRIVKRDERATGDKAKLKNQPSQKTARDMVDTVTTWVNDFQRKRRAETTQAISNLVRARRQPAES